MDRKPASIRRERLHRVVFLLAAAYNVAWGLLTALYPGWLFDLVGMEPMRYPFVFACVGMVVGLYGLVYFEVARRPRRGFLLAAAGLAGKVLGPIGWLIAWLGGLWPAASGIVILTNDLAWWAPFALYLWDSWPAYRLDWKKGW